ncbi:MAG: hypothetical protein FWC56_02490 [Phycisphaerae bacterium]|nr:hypothetical protein [Phycisphaerae bacterium]
MRVQRNHLWGIVCLLAMPILAGCGGQWEYRCLHDVQTSMPDLLDQQWSQRRDFTPAELLAVQSGGEQTLLIAHYTKQATTGDVAQFDERVNYSFVIAIDGRPKVGKTYRVTPDTGRLIESSTFWPAKRPYRGIEGQVTILSASANKVEALVRVTTLTLRQGELQRRLSGIFTFKTTTPDDPSLGEAQIRVTN